MHESVETNSTTQFATVILPVEALPKFSAKTLRAYRNLR